MIRGKFFLSLWITFYLTFTGIIRAHTIEYFYSSYENGSGVLVVNFDVAYAMPDVRDVQEAPQPLRSWLVSQTDKSHAKLRDEAERYLRSYLEFESGGKSVVFDVKFPDFKTDPHDFPKLINAGAYYRVQLIPETIVGARVSILVKEGQFPDLLVAHKIDGQFDFRSVATTELLELESFISKEDIGAYKKVPEVSFSIWQMLVLGFKHVIPDGLDHVLFIIGLCLMAGNFRQLLWQSLVFTIAHTLSMALVISQIFPIYAFWISEYIEAIIAISIAFIAVESLVMKSAFKWRCVVISLFGFVHGLGFAGSLGSTLQFLSVDHWLIPLVLSNLGIEIAQALLVIGCFSLLFYLKKTQRPDLEKHFRSIAALAIAITGLIWFIQRLP